MCHTSMLGSPKRLGRHAAAARVDELFVRTVLGIGRSLLNGELLNWL